MNFDQTKQSIVEQWKQLSLREKISVLYIVLLSIVLIFLPIIHVGSLNSTDLTSFWLFSSPMIRVDVIIGLALISILLRNLSKKVQDVAQRSLGFSSNPLFINVLLLFIILVGLFAIGDTLSLLQSQYSKIEASIYLHIAQIAVVIGIIINTIGSVIKTKSRLPRSNNTEVETIHDDAQSEAFKKVEKEFGGLFTEDEKANYKEHEEEKEVY